MTINAKQLYFILDNTPSEQNIMLVGKHGIGKSRILEDYYAQKNCRVVTLFHGQMSDPGDLIGLPEKNEKTGKTDFMLPYWFPTDDTPVVLFLDELNRARPEVLQTIMDLTLNRKLAGKSLPAGSRIISAVNNGAEYQLTDLDPALVSRFNIYEFVPSVQDWLNWAQESGIDSRIISFISANPEYLDSNDFDMDSASLERHPDRRSWERTSKVICNFSELNDELKPLVTGIIGNKATALFFRYINENSIPTAKEILTGDFSKVSTGLKKLSVPVLTQVNESLFKYIENNLQNQPDQDSSVLNNLSSYFDFISDGSKEVSSHFVSLCSSNSYPKTLAYITEKDFDLYKKIINSL